jgi:hypothetical protein
LEVVQSNSSVLVEDPRMVAAWKLQEVEAAKLTVLVEAPRELAQSEYSKASMVSLYLDKEDQIISLTSSFSLRHHQ